MRHGRGPVLVIEDDPEIQETVRDVLEDEGYRVLTASNGREGLELLRREAEPCLILLDLMMPVMSGAEFLRALRATDVLATIPVIVVSAWPQEVAEVKGQAQAYVKKPVALDALLEIVAKFCPERAREGCDPSPPPSRP